MPMDKETQDQLAAIVAAAVKPVADAVTAQGAKIAELEKLPENIAKVQAANHLDKVEPHAKRLEDVAAKMDEAGIGGHATSGHAAVLRKMAETMRADAAEGKMPHVFHSFMGSAERQVDKADEAVAKAVAAVEASFTKKFDEMKAEADKAQKVLKDELESTKTLLADVKAKAVSQAERPERKTVALSKMDGQLLAKAAIEPNKDTGKLPIEELNKFLATQAHMKPENKIAFKTGLARAGLID